jgi:hypothetical protein
MPRADCKNELRTVVSEARSMSDTPWTDAHELNCIFGDMLSVEVRELERSHQRLLEALNPLLAAAMSPEQSMDMDIYIAVAIKNAQEAIKQAIC